MGEPIRVISNRQPSIVFTAIIVPIILLSVYATIHSGVIANLGSTVAMICMLGIILYYFNSLSLTLTDDRITYKTMWVSNELLVGDILAIGRGRGPFGVGHTWNIRRRDSKAPMVVNVTNFSPHDLQKIMSALIERNPQINISDFRRRADKIS